MDRRQGSERLIKQKITQTVETEMIPTASGSIIDIAMEDDREVDRQTARKLRGELETRRLELELKMIEAKKAQLDKEIAENDGRDKNDAIGRIDKSGGSAKGSGVTDNKPKSPS